MNNPNIDLTWTYINVLISNATNLIIYIAQGPDQRSVNSNVRVNPSININYKYYLNNGGSVFLIAYPADQTKY